MQQVDFHIVDASVTNAFVDFGTPNAVEFDVFGDQVLVGPKIESQAILLHVGFTSNRATTRTCGPGVCKERANPDFYRRRQRMISNTG